MNKWTYVFIHYMLQTFDLTLNIPKKGQYSFVGNEYFEVHLTFVKCCTVNNHQGKGIINYFYMG